MNEKQCFNRKEQNLLLAVMPYMLMLRACIGRHQIGYAWAVQVNNDIIRLSSV